MLLDWLSETKQARLRLKTAIIGRDPTILERAISKFKEYNLSDDEGDLRQAQRLSNIFDARVKLTFGIETKDLQVITQAIDYADSVNAHHAPELKGILARSLLLQKQLILTEEILMSVDNNWCWLSGYESWKKEEIIVMNIFGILLGFYGGEGKLPPPPPYGCNSGYTKIENGSLHLVLGEMGKERLKRRLQSLDVQVLDWHICEQVRPMIEKCKKSMKNKKPKVFKNSFFATVYEWSQNTVKCVEDRLKSRQINISSS